MVEPQAFVLPKKPKVKEKEPPPDQRKIAVIPIRACTDKQLTLGMLRSLILICSYMNRSGITWVSQAKLSKDLQISQQAISKQLVKLVKAGYLEVLRKSQPGERSTTWRVIFDPSIKAEDAIAITSSLEDTRPPYMKEQQAREAEQPDPEGQRRIAQLVAKALKQPTKKEPTMPKPEQSRHVKKVKEEIAQHNQKRQSKAPLLQPPEVVQLTEPHIQPPEVVKPTTARGCAEHSFNKVIYKVNVLNNNKRIELKKAGMKDEQIDDCLKHLVEAYQAEGLTPDPERLVGEILQLARASL